MAGEGQSTVKTLQEKAVAYFCDKPSNFPAGRPYNCCESVLMTMAEYVNAESGFMPKVGTAIGAGVSLNGLLCGSVSSVAMLIGLEYGRTSPEQNPEPVWKMMDEYVADFKKRFGYVDCRQLTKLNLKTPEGLKEYFARVHDHECTQRLRFAVENALRLLGDNGT